MPRHVPVPAVELEGDYSTWTQKWVSDALSIYDLMYGVIDIKNNRVFIRGGAGRTAVLNLVDGSVISDETVSYRYSVQSKDLVSSILGKYVVVTESDTEFRVYKDGSLQQTIDITATELSGYLISYNGKYIIACDRDSRKAYCYEGS